MSSSLWKVTLIHINIKEALALANALDAFSSSGHLHWQQSSHYILALPGLAIAQSCWCLFVGFLRLCPLITFTLISVTFLLLIILRTPPPVFFLCMILSSPLQPGLRCKLSLVADLATPRIWWLWPLICRALWMVPPSLLFPISPSWLFWGQSLYPASWSSWWPFFKPLCFFPHYPYPTGFAVCRNSLFCLYYCYSWCLILQIFGGLFFNRIHLSYWPPGFSGHSSFPLTTGLFFLLASPLGFMGLSHLSE